MWEDKIQYTIKELKQFLKVILDRVQVLKNKNNFVCLFIVKVLYANI